jgi:putative endonuclease
MIPSQRLGVKAYYVYMLLCADGSYYIGVTSNLEHRIAQHEYGEYRECYTFTRRPVRLVYCSDFREVIDAINWEKHIKRWSRAKKQALAANNWPRISELARNHTDASVRSANAHGSTGSP